MAVHLQRPHAHGAQRFFVFGDQDAGHDVQTMMFRS
jgi:hypothetical protein